MMCCVVLCCVVLCCVMFLVFCLSVVLRFCVVLFSQVPPDEGAEFQDFLNELGYTYHDETRNPVYEQFFKSGR